MEKEWIEPACLILVPVLYFAGAFFKRAGGFPDRWIPLTLGGIGVVLGTAVILSTGPFPENGRQWLEALCAGAVQGILCAGTAVYGNQIVRQGKKDRLSPEEYRTSEGPDEGAER